MKEDIYLLVIHPFGNYRRGDFIKSKKEIKSELILNRKKVYIVKSKPPKHRNIFKEL